MHTTGIQNRSFEAWLGKMKVCFFFTQVTVINFMKNMEIDVDHGTAEYLYSLSTFLVNIIIITDLPVYRVEMINLKVVKDLEFLDNHLRFDLHMMIAADGQDVRGENLWRVAVWAGTHGDGSGQRAGEMRQVL